MTSKATQQLAVKPETVPLAQVERELGRRLKAIQGLHASEGPVLRACMSNLIIYCDSPALAERVTSEVPDIVLNHPARVLILCVNPAASDGVTASVCVRGRLTDAGRWMCSEQITLTASQQMADRFPFAIRPLLVGDLPTNLWWAASSPPPLAGTLLFELAEPAQQVVYDSIGWPEPARGVVAVASWLEQLDGKNHHHSWRTASDLNWRRLKIWRRLLAQALDPNTAPGAVFSITDVLVEHGPHAVIQAWELVSWLAARLGWQVQTGRVQPGVEIDWQLKSAHGPLTVRVHRLPDGPSEVRHLRIACTIDGKSQAMNLIVQDEHRLAIVLEGNEAEPRTMAVQPAAVSELLSRQLSDRERAPVFFQSMAVARQFAQSVL